VALLVIAIGSGPLDDQASLGMGWKWDARYPTVKSRRLRAPLR